MKEPHQPEPISSDELFRRHAAFVARFLCRLGVDDDALDDCVQDVFMVVHRRGGYLPGPAKPTSYLAAIAVHTAADHRRRRGVQNARDAGNEVDAVASQNGDPAHCLEQREQLRVLQRALEKLDPTLQTTLLLADGEGETCVSIAAAMNVPLGTVYWRLSHARKKFRLALRTVQAAEGCGQPRPRAHAMGLMVLGGFGWRGSFEAALLRMGSAPAPGDYDVARGLVRHRLLGRSAATVARSAVVTTGKSLFGVSSWSWPALGAGVMSVAAGVLIAPHPSPATEPSGSAPSMEVASSRVLSAINPLGSEAIAASHRGDLSDLHSVSSHASEAERRDSSRGRRAHQRGRDRSAVMSARTSPGRSSRTLGSSEASNARTEHGGDGEALDAPSEQRADGRTDASEARPEQDAQAQAAAQHERLLVEAREIARAERLLSYDPEAALAVIQALRASPGSTYLREECDYVEVMALHQGDHDALARERGRVFLRRYPTSAFARRVAKAVQDIEAHAR